MGFGVAEFRATRVLCLRMTPEGAVGHAHRSHERHFRASLGASSSSLVMESSLCQFFFPETSRDLNPKPFEQLVHWQPEVSMQRDVLFSKWHLQFSSCTQHTLPVTRKRESASKIARARLAVKGKAREGSLERGQGRRLRPACRPTPRSSEQVSRRLLIRREEASPVPWIPPAHGPVWFAASSAHAASSAWPQTGAAKERPQTCSRHTAWSVDPGLEVYTSSLPRRTLLLSFHCWQGSGLSVVAWMHELRS